MRTFFRTIREFCRRVDPVLFFATLGLSVIGLVTVVGCLWGEYASLGRALRSSAFLMQIAMTLFGTVCMFVIANMDYRVIVDKFWIIMLVASAGLLAVTLVFGSSGETIETSNKSWLRIPGIGINVQPSEFVKITFICTFAKHLSLVGDRINRPLALLGLGAHAGVIVGLILLSGDLGVALVYMGIVLVMLFCAGLSLWYYVGAGGILALLFPYLWEKLRTDQKERILYGFNPEGDPLDKGFQPLMSRRAIANGGVFGRGIRGGTYYQNLTTGRLTDYIFAAICEKFGFFGGLLVIGVFVVVVARLVMICSRNGAGYGKFICVGIAAMVLVQTLESVGMCLAMMPVIGITLPFISCGGSSVLATYLLFGFAQSVYVHSGPGDRFSESFRLRARA